jgi:hypothetical protein
VLRNAAGAPLTGAAVVLTPDLRTRSATEGHPVSKTLPSFETVTDPDGQFRFAQLSATSYRVSVRWRGQTAKLESLVVIHEGEAFEAGLEFVPGQDQVVLHLISAGDTTSGAGERLSSREVASLPLNKRDFSQLLLLAAGTMTDVNGAANFTQQFAVNGQRGSTAVFAMDGVQTTDPEQSGATFANFNVDAIQEVRSDSGAVPATIGHGAAGYTEVVTKSGTSEVHGVVFEFLRNAALDARNFFDRRSLVSPGRIPPFVRNEFGFTNGGPVVLPGLYDGRKRTYYFGQYQGFRQVLGTTQVFPVPTPEERLGKDSTAFPGDTLNVPVSASIAPLLARYPLPNDPQGPYGGRTYATSSKVETTSDQFSIRVDHHISDKGQLFSRFSFNNVRGPTTNPAQSAIDPSFAILFFDHQRNDGATYTRTVSAHFVSESTIGYERSTPIFSSPNHSQPALLFSDNLYEPFNSASGQVIGSYGNLFQFRQNFTLTRGRHTLKFGAETDLNRDTIIFGVGVNGAYTFGGGQAYAPVAIPSASGLHDIHVGDPLPDSLTGLLTATPFSFVIDAAPPMFPQGDHFDEGAPHRESFNFYLHDTWKVSPHLTLNYGLRYELNTRIHEPHKLTSVPLIVNAAGQSAPFWDPEGHYKFLVDPQPPYLLDKTGWGPRVALAWQLSDHTTLRAGAGITTILPNLFQTNSLMGTFPFVYNAFLATSPGHPVRFENSVLQFNFPPYYTPEGNLVYPSGKSTDVAPNTEIDLQRFEEDVAALTPGSPIQPPQLGAMSPDFQNGYIENFTAGLERRLGDVVLDLAYVGSAGVKLPSLINPNGYGGADPAVARFTLFGSAGQVLGGLGPVLAISSRSHSTFHSLQAGVKKTSLKAGLGFQASYTFSKTIDDTSNVFGGIFGSGTSGAVLQANPADPLNPGLEKGPSNFDVTHVLAVSVIQDLPFDRLPGTQRLGRFATGWQFLNITTLTSGQPFSVFSGIQQTGGGAGGGDRPDQVGSPVLSTGRTVREDYFGRGAANTAFFAIPLNVPGGTGPYQGRLGTLGRNTFRGPAYHNFDVALIKDTSFGHRAGNEALTLQFRAEFFNVFNLVNFGLPANIVRGTGFGLISHTAGPSRQIQCSLKLIY